MNNSLGDIRICHLDELVLWKSLKNIDLVFTSPPYNIGSKSCKKIGRRRLGGYDVKSWGAIQGYADSISEEGYQVWQKDMLERYASVLKVGGVIAYNHKERHVKGRFIQPESWFPETLELFDKIVWDRKSTHNHCQSYSYQQHEYVYLLKRCGEKHFFNMGRLDSVVQIPPDVKNKHNAPMPVKLAIQVICKFCPEHGLVCDPFLGSGTTAVACMFTGRRFVGAEKLKKYVNLAHKRVQEAV